MHLYPALGIGQYEKKQYYKTLLRKKKKFLNVKRFQLQISFIDISKLYHIVQYILQKTTH